MITGAAGHLGRAVTAAFAEQGARLVLVDVQAQALEAAFGGDPQRLLVVTDLLDAARSGPALTGAIEQCGGLDVLCHLAGGFRMGEAVHETSVETWDFLIDINARTFLNVARAAVPPMLARGGGKIVAVGAYAALHGAARMGAYVAAKSSLIRLVETMSGELRAHHINVNCVLPTIIDTPDNRLAMPDADPARWVEPQALAEVITFLASDAARAVHGAALPVTGLV
jgi:NAD(P)-dependent dehydrogenase (short-subunit alcohol dehydrogenase family)